MASDRQEKSFLTAEVQIVFYPSVCGLRPIVPQRQILYFLLGMTPGLLEEEVRLPCPRLTWLFKDVESSLSFVKEHGLEGIVSKAEDSPYLPGQRSRFWRKRKLIRTMDLVVMGVNAVGSRIRSFGAGVYDTKGRLLFLGNVGSGLNQNDLDFLADAVPLLALEPPK